MLTSLFPPPSQLLGNSDHEAFQKFDGLIHLLERIRDGESLVPSVEVDNSAAN
jgi:hypothetical protein